MKKVKKGKKFVPLLNQNEEIILPGRHPCTCEGISHQLINNCLNCGRIVCSQEGTGPCFTCSKNIDFKKANPTPNNINKKTNLETIKNNSKSRQLKDNNLKSYDLKDIASSLNKAIEHKNRLLEFDQNCEKRTRVIDDQSDYYKLESQHWLNSDQRVNIQKKINYLQKNKFLKKRDLFIDIDNCKFGEKLTPIIKDVNEFVSNVDEEAKFKSDYELIDCKSINLDQELPKVEYVNHSFFTKPSTDNELKNIFNQFKLQDSTLMEMSDEGICLSVRQPYASLIMSKIKLHEGRNWYTPYRGRVWIHSSSRATNSGEINAAKTFFSLVCKEDKFPEDYPSSLLLGYVELEDCLPREQYLDKYASDYMDSTFVFIFNNPHPLKVNLPMKAKSNKLFTLDLDVHRAAIKQLL